MTERSNDKFAAILGFARRAGKAVYGYDTLKAAKGVALYAVSDTASDNLQGGMKRLALERKKPLVAVKALECTVGSNVKALGITDRGMADGMLAYVGTGTDDRYTLIDQDNI